MPSSMGIRHTFRVRSGDSEYLVNREWLIAFAADAEQRCGLLPESRGPDNRLRVMPALRFRAACP